MKPKPDDYLKAVVRQYVTYDANRGLYIPFTKQLGGNIEDREDCVVIKFSDLEKLITTNNEVESKEEK